MAESTIELFFSYSHRDEDLRNKLEIHLSILKRQGIIQTWHDRKIEAGTEWANVIDEQMKKADIILLLISPDFLYSDYCYDIELDLAMQRHAAGEACVIPVILRSVDWKGGKFGQLQAFPTDAKPITSWTNSDEAFTNVTQGIRIVAEKMRAEKQRKFKAKQLAMSQYREQVREFLQDGKISEVERDILDDLQSNLSLTPEEAAEIERTEQQAYQQKATNLEKYRQTFLKVMQQSAFISPEKRRELQKRQQFLNLTEEEVAEIEAPIVANDDLKSERKIDYTRLCNLLKAQKWKEADRETYEVMIRAVGKKSGDLFTSDELLNFPCTDLKTIDSLWVKYSKGNFGFSVQKQIYVECGARLDGNYPGDEIWEKFCDRVGWHKDGEWLYYDDLNPSLSSPQGIFPVGGCGGYSGVWVKNLFSRTEICKV